MFEIGKKQSRPSSASYALAVQNVSALRETVTSEYTRSPGIHKIGSDMTLVQRDPVHDSLLVVNLTINSVERSLHSQNENKNPRIPIPIKLMRESSTKHELTVTQETPANMQLKKKTLKGSPTSEKETIMESYDQKQKEQFNTIFVKMWKLAVHQLVKKQPLAEQIPTIKIQKEKFLKLLQTVYIAYYKIRPDLIQEFIKEAFSPQVPAKSGKEYSLNDFQDFVYFQIFGKQVLNQHSDEIDQLLRKIHQLIIGKTVDGNFTLQDYNLIKIDHSLSHLVQHKLDAFVKVNNNSPDQNRQMVTIKSSQSTNQKKIRKGLTLATQRMRSEITHNQSQIPRLDFGGPSHQTFDFRHDFPLTDKNKNASFTKKLGKAEFGNIQNKQVTTKAQLDIETMIQRVQRKSDLRKSYNNQDLVNQFDLNNEQPDNIGQVALSKLPNSKLSSKPKRFFSAVSRKTDCTISHTQYDEMNQGLVKDLQFLTTAVSSNQSRYIIRPQFSAKIQPKAIGQPQYDKFKKQVFNEVARTDSDFPREPPFFLKNTELGSAQKYIQTFRQSQLISGLLSTRNLDRKQQLQEQLQLGFQQNIAKINLEISDRQSYFASIKSIDPNPISQAKNLLSPSNKILQNSPMQIQGQGNLIQYRAAESKSQVRLSSTIRPKKRIRAINQKRTIVLTGGIDDPIGNFRTLQAYMGCGSDYIVKLDQPRQTLVAMIENRDLIQNAQNQVIRQNVETKLQHQHSRSFANSIVTL